MNVGEVRVAEDRDFEILKIYLSRNDGWRLEYERGDTRVWTRTPPDLNGSAFKMIRLKTRFPDVPPQVLYDVLHDPEYRRTWDRFMMEGREIGHLNPNNNISYYAISCPSPLKNRDFVIQSSWLETPQELMIINHSVFHKDMPGRKGFVRGVSYLTGFVVSPIPNSGGCTLGYITHSNPKGNLPTWVTNKLSSSLAPKLIRKLHKACLKYPSWKESTKSVKPWLFPEQINTPRIRTEDCRPTNDDTSSPEENIDEEAGGQVCCELDGDDLSD